MGKRVASVSVFFPAYNDARSLPRLLARTFDVLESFVRDYEVIVVNDGSTDVTGLILEASQSIYGDRLRVVTHPETRGYGGALQSGFQAATKELVHCTDGDGQYDVRELPLFLEEMTQETGLVNGYKLQRHDPWHRVAIGSVHNRLARLLFHVRLRDIDCDFRLVRRSLLEKIQLTSTSGTICVELVRKVELSGFSVVEVPVHHYARLHGRSQFFRLRSLLTTFAQSLCLYLSLVVVASPVWRRLSALLSLRHSPIAGAPIHSGSTYTISAQ